MVHSRVYGRLPCTLSVDVCTVRSGGGGRPGFARLRPSPSPTPEDVMIRLLCRRRYKARLAAAKQWQAEERAAARDRLAELADTTPDPVRKRQ